MANYKNGISDYGMPGGQVQRPNYAKRITGTNGTGKVELQNSYAQELVSDYIKRIQRNSDAMKKKSKVTKGRGRKK